MSDTVKENVSAEILTNEENTNSEDQSVKVFVGNIEYKVTDEQLKEHFASIKFDDLKISKRKDVSVGYGFITFSDEEEAKKCVSQFDKTELQGRPLKVELAKEKNETIRRGSRRSIRGRGGRRNGYNRRNRKQNNDKKETNENANASASEESSNEDNKNESSGSESANENNGNNGKNTKPRYRRNRRYSQRKPREGGEPSKTTIYVANLPFKTSDEKLKEAFADYQVSNVHVARFKTGRSKGYGFIEVENEEVQKKILCECTNKTIEGRAISLKVALNFAKEEAATVEAGNENTEAIAVAAEQQ